PVPPKRILVTGADGQVGRALRALYGDAPHIEYAARHDLDLTDPALSAARPWREYGTIINAAAYTDVDGAETQAGRMTAWQVNAAGPAALARIATENRIALVHISSDYVYDGRNPDSDSDHDSAPYREDRPFSPLGVYGQSK